MVLKNSYWITILCFMSAVFVYAQKQGYTENQLTNGNYDNRYASYNKAGNQIIFESNRDGHWQIYVMNINGTRQLRLISSKYNDRRPSWHPFKNMILFESDRKGYSEFYTYDLDTRELKRIPIPIKGNKLYGQFAPNGQEMIFNHKVDDNNFNIYMCNLKGKRLKKLVDNAHANLYPRFSSRGDAFVYFSRKDTQGETDEIYSYNIILKEDSRLTEWPTHNFVPTYSNDRNHIVYAQSMEGSKPEIFIMTKNGSSIHRITFNENSDTLPNWSPKDINLLITGERNGNYHICKILLKEPFEGTEKPFEVVTKD